MASSQKPSPNDEKRLATRRKVSEFRRRQREKGLRLVQIWVPDVNSPEFIAEARRQSRAVATEQDQLEQEFIDSISEIWEK
jgi:ABC-type uncharacterized transport system substrate-binding protein